MNRLSGLPAIAKRLRDFLVAVVTVAAALTASPASVLAATNYKCPLRQTGSTAPQISDADCAAISGSWVNWTPETVGNACSTTGATIPPGTPEQNGKAIFDTLVSRGLQPFQAAGVIGNMTAESGLQPQRLQGSPSLSVTTAEEYMAKYNAKGTGWGLVQFTPGSKFITKVPNIADANNLGTQLDFVWNQLQGTGPLSEKQAGDDLKATTNIRDAVLAFQGNKNVGGPYIGYERPADEAATVPDRLSFAISALTKYGSGGNTTTAGSGGVSATTVCGGSSGGGSSGWFWPAKNSFHSGPCWNVLTSSGYHAGMDINSDAKGNIAIAAHDGVVTKARDVVSDGAGKYVTVRTNDPTPVYYSYEHLDSLSVSVGQPVTGGQTQIGIIGTTGHVIGAPLGHLHFETAVSDALGNYSPASQVGTPTRDPMDYLPKPAPFNYSCSR